MSERPPHNDPEDEQRFRAADFGYGDGETFEKIGNGGKNGKSKEKNKDKKPKRGGKREVKIEPVSQTPETPTSQAPEITTKKSPENEIPPESQKIPKEVPTPTPPAEKPQLPKVETTKISPASTPEKLKSAELPEEGYFPLRRDRLKQKPETPPQSEPTTPTEKNWSEKLSDPELLEAARIAIAAQETPLGIFQFMKKRSNYSAEKLQDLYDRLKSAGVIKFEDGAEKVTITKKDLDLKTPPRSENLETKNKPNPPPQQKNKSSIKFGPKIRAKETQDPKEPAQSRDLEISTQTNPETPKPKIESTSEKIPEIITDLEGSWRLVEKGEVLSKDRETRIDKIGNEPAQRVLMTLVEFLNLPENIRKKITIDSFHELVIYNQKILSSCQESITKLKETNLKNKNRIIEEIEYLSRRINEFAEEGEILKEKLIKNEVTEGTIANILGSLLVQINNHIERINDKTIDIDIKIPKTKLWNKSASIINTNREKNPDNPSEATPTKNPQSEPEPITPESKQKEGQDQNENKKASVEEIAAQTEIFNQKYEEEFEKAKAEDDINAPEIRDFVQKKLDLLADIRRLNWEISSTLEKTAGDKNLDKLKALYESNSASIKERFAEIDTINQQIGKTEGLKSPETSTKPTPEEIREFKIFLENIQGTTKTHLEGIEKLIESEEKKPTKGLTLQYLKQADDALRALWNAALETPIDTVDLKEVRKILGNLAASTGNYIGQLGEKISKEKKSIQNAEKVKRFFEIHDEKYQSTAEKVGGWLKKYRPLFVKTAIFLPLIFSLQTQETQKEGVRESVGSKVVTVDSVQSSSDPLFEHSNLSSNLKIGQQPSLDSLFNKNPK